MLGLWTGLPPNDQVVLRPFTTNAAAALPPTK
jgi:hypothetical protein